MLFSLIRYAFLIINFNVADNKKDTAKLILNISSCTWTQHCWHQWDWVTTCAQDSNGADGRPLKPNTYNAEDEVTQIIQQFRDVAAENSWTERKKILNLRSSLCSPAKAYRCAEATEVVFQALSTTCGTSVRQAKDKLIALSMDSQSSVFELAIEISLLLSLAHSHIPIADREQIVVDYLIHSVENHVMQRHLLSVDTSTMEGIVRAIEKYLAIGAQDQYARLWLRTPMPAGLPSWRLHLKDTWRFCPNNQPC